MNDGYRLALAHVLLGPEDGSKKLDRLESVIWGIEADAAGEATTRERERAAKIAEGYRPKTWDRDQPPDGIEIAKKIREGG